MLKLQILSKKNKTKEKNDKDDSKTKKKHKNKSKKQKEYAMSEESIKRPKKVKNANKTSDKSDSSSKSSKSSLRSKLKSSKTNKEEEMQIPVNYCENSSEESSDSGDMMEKMNYIRGNQNSDVSSSDDEFEYEISEKPVYLHSQNSNLITNSQSGLDYEEDADEDENNDNTTNLKLLSSGNTSSRYSNQRIPRLPTSSQLMKEKKKENNVIENSPKKIHWQMGGLLGSGSYGQVRMGLNTENGELIAVKQVPIPDDYFLHHKLLSSQNFAQNLSNPVNILGNNNVNGGLHEKKDVKEDDLTILQKEIEILRSLRHENIVRYLGTSIEENMLNIFLEYVPGGSLYSLLQKMGAFPEEIIAKYTKQILLGLQYLHSYNIIHRDIKGANILVDARGTIKLADFGASKKIEGVVNSISGKSSLKGTPYWMAPEIARQESITCKSDIWSLGCTVVEMATGKPPFNECPDQVSALFHIATLKARPQFQLSLSPIALNFLKKCFHLVAEKRASASELLKHPFITNINGVSYSSPDYRQAGIISDRPNQKQESDHSSKIPYSDSLFPIHKKYPNPLSSGSSSRGYSQPVASPFMFLRKSTETTLDNQQQNPNRSSHNNNNKNNNNNVDRKSQVNKKSTSSTNNTTDKTHARRLSDYNMKKK